MYQDIFSSYYMYHPPPTLDANICSGHNTPTQTIFHLSRALIRGSILNLDIVKQGHVFQRKDLQKVICTDISAVMFIYMDAASRCWLNVYKMIINRDYSQMMT